MDQLRAIGETRHDPVYNLIFQHSKSDRNTLDIHRFVRQLRRLGLSVSDPRLADIERNIEICQNQIIDSADDDEHLFIDFDCFKGIIGSAYFLNFISVLLLFLSNKFTYK